MVHSSELPLDIMKLEALTDGKHTFQEEILEMFFCNISECLKVMEKAIKDSDSQKWEDAACDLRDISASIGAVELSNICNLAKKVATSTKEEKQKIQSSIQSNVQKLRVFIKNTRY